MQAKVSFLGINQVIYLFDNFSIALTHYKSSAYFEQWHEHTLPSLSLLLKGNYQEDMNKSSFKRSPGDLKYIPSSTPHQCYNYSSNTQKINLEFQPQLWHQLGLNECEFIDKSRRQDSKFLLLRLFKLAGSEIDASQVSMQMLLHDFFGNEERLCMKSSMPAWTRTLRSHLADSPEKNWTLQDLSQITGLHPVSLSRAFPFYFGCTFSTYLRKLKINKALSLIHNKKHSLTEIAYICGFSDQSHFIRSFKKMTGYLPLHFRNL